MTEDDNNKEIAEFQALLAQSIYTGELDLGGVNLTDKLAPVLADFLRTNQTLKTLVIKIDHDINVLSKASRDSLTKSISNHQGLVRLDFTVEIIDKDAKNFSEAVNVWGLKYISLRMGDTYQEWVVNGDNILDRIGRRDALSAFINELHYEQQIAQSYKTGKLDLRDVFLNNKLGLMLADFLSKNPPVNILIIKIRFYYAYRESRKALAKAILDNKKLIRLDLELELADVDDSKMFAKALEENQHIKFLSLDLVTPHYTITDEENFQWMVTHVARALLRRIIQDPKLISIDVSKVFANLYPKYRDPTLNQKILDNFPEKSNLSKIAFSPFKEVVQDFQPDFKNLKKITSDNIKLKFKTISLDNYKSLLPVISTIGLTELDLPYCKLKANHISAILDACPNLRKFRVWLKVEEGLIKKCYHYYNEVSEAVMRHPCLIDSDMKISFTKIRDQKIFDELMEYSMTLKAKHEAHLKENRQRDEFETKKALLTFMRRESPDFDFYLAPFISEPAGLVKPKLWK